MMVSFAERLKRLLANDFFAAFLFLIAYLCTHSYIYGWDDQHLEVPLLKHLIDPSLYKGDYYVESLARHFSSYLYPVLAKFITVAQVPAAYFILFLTARFFIFFWLYKLWQLISKDKFTSACAILMFMVLGRTEEFLYRTFSHQIAGECLMFAGIYFFYKERFMLAALIFGLGANIHGLYNLFPMLYMLVFLLFFHPRRWSMVLKTGLIFIISCLPFLLWQIPNSWHDKLIGAPVPVSEWLALYRKQCPENFLFWNIPWPEALGHPSFILQRLEPYLFLIMVYVFLLVVYPPFRGDRKTHVVVMTAYALIVISCVFTYLIPSRFVLDLCLLRNQQFVRLLLMGYATIWAVQTVKQANPRRAFAGALLFLLIGFAGWSFFVIKLQNNGWVIMAMAVVFGFLSLRRWPRLELYLRRALIIIPLLGAFISFCKFHYDYLQVKNHGTGFWQLQRNWEDMQRYVREHTPKDAMILAPINMDMGGFRIHSERKVVVCIRDCGVGGFDYGALVEWDQRMRDMKDFVVITNHSVVPAVLTAILKYKVDYIVFMKYYEPPGNISVLKKMYANEAFSLFKVMVHP
ncbi:MAG: hypothetical protein HY209_06200 [Candidatus Omnitrophica bacterium]|nr:hypothetical protein [Candidatus Omnitrophota bacterium]